MKTKEAQKPTELESLLLAFLKEGGAENFAQIQSKTQQEEYWKWKEAERKNLIREKFEYLTWRKKEGMDFTDEMQKEYDFVRFHCETLNLEIGGIEFYRTFIK